MARAFGLGSPTGIGAVAEASGNISVPTTLIQATNQVIGQGDVLVTPLQVARFVAAVGNGGTLYTPQLIQEIQSADGKPVSEFKPEAAGTLPIQPDRLAAIQQAMQWVISDPRGTGILSNAGIDCADGRERPAPLRPAKHCRMRGSSGIPRMSKTPTSRILRLRSSWRTQAKALITPRRFSER